MFGQSPRTDTKSNPTDLGLRVCWRIAGLLCATAWFLPILMVGRRPYEARLYIERVEALSDLPFVDPISAHLLRFCLITAAVVVAASVLPARPLVVGTSVVAASAGLVGMATMTVAASNSGLISMHAYGYFLTFTFLLTATAGTAWVVRMARRRPSVTRREVNLAVTGD